MIPNSNFISCSDSVAPFDEDKFIETNIDQYITLYVFGKVDCGHSEYENLGDMKVLPTEVFFKIFSYLNPVELDKIALINKSFYQFTVGFKEIETNCKEYLKATWKKESKAYYLKSVNERTISSTEKAIKKMSFSINNAFSHPKNLSQRIKGSLHY